MDRSRYDTRNSFDEPLVLIASDGSQTSVLCDTRSIGSNEFYSAVGRGLRPEKRFEIRSFEYAGQPKARFGSVVYSVIRSYESRANPEILELVCRQVAADVGA